MYHTSKTPEQYLASKFGIKGKVEVRLWDENGNLKDSRTIKELTFIPNTVTTFGDKQVANRLSGATIGAPSHMAIGTGTGGGSGSNSVVTELDRNALTSTTQGTGANDNDVIYVADWAAGDGTGAITEAGIMNASSGPGMTCYASFSAVNKAAGDTLQITWTVTFGAS